MVSGRFGLRRWVALMVLFCLATAPPAATWAIQAQQADMGPEIDARAAVVVEYPSGKILYSRAMHDRLAPASTTKILTAILAMEHGNIEDEVTVSPEDLVGESTMGLESGERQTLHNLLYGMLLPSGNDAAMAVARHLASEATTPNSNSKDPISRFADMMNARLAQLGLADSHFVNPHGLDAEGHYSSAYDLASLTWYALHFPVFNDAVKTPFYQAPGHPLKNTNEMLSRYPGADGAKTGWTDAGGLCLVTTATRDGHRLISVVLNAPHWYSDSGAILDYGFANLAAASQADGAEILSVTQRGAANWLLASSTPAQAAIVNVGPQGVSMGQGGGAASQPDSARSVGVSAPLQEADKTSPKEAVARNGALQVAARTMTPANSSWWMLVVATMLALVAWRLVATRLRTFSFSPRSVVSLKSISIPRFRMPVRASRPVIVVRSPLRQEVAPRPLARTLGVPPMPRRREPNLLLSTEDTCRQHLYRAVELAAEGRQGSSMSEFMLALRSGCDFSAADIDGALGLTSAAFLAFARAQQAAGRREAARETLMYALSATPGDRLLQLSLFQLTNYSETHA